MGRAGSGAAAHRREVKDLAVSKDVSLLLSASADATLAVWNIDTDRQMTTMNGHRDEVSQRPAVSRFVWSTYMSVAFKR